MALSFIEGNEAVALGAMSAGCRFFAGYPITPATTIYNAMLKYLPPEGGVCLQGEDEIASIGYCLGASMAGHKVLTATSGPGISLYSEQISFAIGSEIPMVHRQRPTPGPLHRIGHQGSRRGYSVSCAWGQQFGGQPVIVLAPVDVGRLLPSHHAGLQSGRAVSLPGVPCRQQGDLHDPGDSVNPGFHGKLPALSSAAMAGSGRPPSCPLVPQDDECVPGLSAHRRSNAWCARLPPPMDPTDTSPWTPTKSLFQLRLYEKAERRMWRPVHLFDQMIWTAEGAKTLVVAYGVTARAARLKQLFRAAGASRPPCWC
jgi:2-oxoglutarate ferredoxin oxidoreductase subunit alpha